MCVARQKMWSTYTVGNKGTSMYISSMYMSITISRKGAIAMYDSLRHAVVLMKQWSLWPSRNFPNNYENIPSLKVVDSTSPNY